MILLEQDLELVDHDRTEGQPIIENEIIFACLGVDPRLGLYQAADSLVARNHVGDVVLEGRAVIQCEVIRSHELRTPYSAWG
jgi:hypothetical protein